MTGERRKEILNQIEEWAKQGLRTLSLAHRKIELPETEITDVEDGSLDNNLTLIGIIGIKDPVRVEVPDAVLDCQRAGIVVRMLTGDNILTAKDIARQCNILTDKGISIEGPEFRKISDSDIVKI